MTLLLTRSDIEELLDLDDAVEALRGGFAATAAPDATTVPAQRVRTDLPGPGTATVLLPGLLPGIAAYTVKVNAKFPGSSPALRGIVCLHDLASGELLALIDSASLTAWRTGLAAAVATHELARKGADSVAVVGAGTQARVTVRGLARLRSLSSVHVVDVDTQRAESFATGTGSLYSVDHYVATSPAAAAAAADIVVVATWSHQALLDVPHVRPGQHVTSLGADEPGKAELSARLLRHARLFTDDQGLAETSGALGTAGLDRSVLAGVFGDVAHGTVPARTEPDDVTAYIPVGLPWQDLALAWSLYRRATDQRAGARLDLLA